MLMIWEESMNFKVLNGDIYFSDEFVKLNDIRAEFLKLAFNSVSTFTEECTNKFNSIEQLLKDGESFGYEYLNSYILLFYAYLCIKILNLPLIISLWQTIKRLFSQWWE